jgi:Na+:H+ antiporter, NhaA family
VFGIVSCTPVRGSASLEVVQMADDDPPANTRSRLQRPVDRSRDHIRGGHATASVVTVVVYADYLCPYCRRLRFVLARLRETVGERLAYVFRHFPNEAAHPGATFIARVAEAAGKQDRFWEMHDWLIARETTPTKREIDEFVQEQGFNLAQFDRDLDGDETRRRVAEDLADGRRNGVTGTPTFFVDGERYDGAWTSIQCSRRCNCRWRHGFNARPAISPICLHPADWSCC